MFKIASLLTVLAVSLTSTNALVSTGLCPEFQNVETFDIPPYLGRWYEMQRFFASFEADMTCVTADYAGISDTQIRVTNTANVNGSVTQLVGVGTATGTPGQLIVQFPGSPAGGYNVLATDYTTYSCVYSCSQIGSLRDEFAWLLSRTPSVDNDTLAMAEQVFTDNGIDVSDFLVTYQGDDCIYVPED